MRWKRVFTGPTLAALAVLGVGAGVLFAAVQGLGLTLMKRPVPPARPMYLLSDALGPYHKAETLRLSKAIGDELGTERHVFRTYRVPDDEGSAVRLLLAYQTGVPDAVPHVPRRLFALGGARGEIVGRRRIELPGHRVGEAARQKLAVPATAGDESEPTNRMGKRAGGVTVPFTLMRVRSAEGSGRPVVAGYLFIANGRPTGRAGAVRRWVSDLKTERAYWCRIEIVPGRVRGERFRGTARTEEAGAAIERFLGDALPDIISVLPDRNGSRPVR